MTKAGRVALNFWALSSVTCVAVCAPLSAVAVAHADATVSQAEQANRQFAIAAQSLIPALNEFGRQSGRDILFSTEVADRKHSPGVSGQMSAEEALRTLLAGTGLRFRATNERTFLVETANVAPAGAASPVNRGAKAAGDDKETAAQEPNVEKVTVTGTRVRGKEPVGSQVIIIDRTEIERSGAGTTQEVLNNLPQNFQGGVSEDTRTGAEGSTNIGRSSSPNLRGLGAGSTLTLLNGRRMNIAGGNGLFVDISSIPVTAIERIEVLTDGASAIYGSDAVGGVINIVLRKNYDGAETQVRYGHVTDGDLQEMQASQTVGLNWSQGNLLLSYEFYHRDELPSEDRVQAANCDLTNIGGQNFCVRGGSPGNIVIGAQTWGIPDGQDGTALTPAQLLLNQPNFFNSREGTFLLPEQERQSLFAALSQQVDERLELSAEFLLSRRTFHVESAISPVTMTVPSTNAFYVDPFCCHTSVRVVYDLNEDLGPRITEGPAVTLNSSVGARYDVGGGWEAKGYVAYAHEVLTQFAHGNFLNSAALNTALASSNPATSFNPFGDGSYQQSASVLAAIQTYSIFGSDSELRSANVTLDGPVFDLPGGQAVFALGADYREETFVAKSTGSSSSLVTADFEREVQAYFAELFIPIVSEENRLPGIERLEISLAERYEDYSDASAVDTPKVGAMWSPVDGLELKGTWGKSVKTPNLSSLDTTNNSVVYTPFLDPSAPGGLRNTLALTGGNPDLTQEEATIWTVGAQVKPNAIPNLMFGVNYFNVDFTDRIIQLDVIGSALYDPAYADAVIINPSAAQIAAACANGLLLGALPPCSGLPATAIADFRIRNAAHVTLSGVDLQGDYRYAFDFGDVGAGFNATYFFDYKQALSSKVTPNSVVDTVFNPVDLKVRGRLWWADGGYRADLFVNYTDDYVDNVSLARRPVSSWTTLDLNLSYTTSEDDDILGKGIVFGFNVRNLFDEDPPFVNNSAGIGYDPQNADLVGRFVSVRVGKTW
jgi:iron complex outermembrane recepter protein